MLDETLHNVWITTTLSQNSFYLDGMLLMEYKPHEDYSLRLHWPHIKIKILSLLQELALGKCLSLHFFFSLMALPIVFSHYIPIEAITK